MTPASRSKLSPVLEVAASTRVLQARRAAALACADSGVVLGRHFLTFQALAERCAAEAGLHVRGILEVPALARLVGNCCREVEPFGSLARAQPGIARALSSTLRDLRDAGVAPQHLPASHGALRGLYERVEAALEALRREHGLLDDVGLLREAANGAGLWARRLGLARAEVHGATELVGSQGDLLSALSAAVPLRIHPLAMEDPHAREIRSRWPWPFVVEPARSRDTSLPLDGPLPRGALRLVPVSGGPLEELERIAGEILRLLDGGVAPTEIGVVARTLEPYASWLATVLDRYGIPYSSSLAEPALLYPEGRSVLWLARALLADLEREAVVELLNAPAFRAEPERHGRAKLDGLGELAERLARRGGVVHGHDDWRRTLANAAELLREEKIRPSPAALDRLSKTLEALAGDAARAREAPGWRGAIRIVLEAADRWLPVEGGEEGEAISTTGALAREGVCAALRSLEPCDVIDEVSADGESKAGEATLRSLEEALGAAPVRPYAQENGGVLVLDAVQARGLSFGHLFLLGLNEAQWPRLLEEDPFLSDDVRTVLRKKLTRPVPVRSDVEADERLLFRLIASQASASITASFHRRDASGRAATASPYLRELIERAPDAEDLLSKLLSTASEEVPEASQGESDLTPFRSALVAAAVQEGPHTLRAIAERGPEDLQESVGRGLDHLDAVEGFDPSDLRFDGRVEGNASRAGGTLRPTKLEGLARCPLRAFFADILGVPDFEETSTAEPDARALGSLIHEALRSVYEALYERDLLRDPAGAPRALAWVEAELDRILSEEILIGYQTGYRHAGLREGMRRQLRVAVEDFIRWDIGRTVSEGVANLACEDAFEREMALGEEQVRLRGRVDRWVELSAGRLRVSDYKTGRTPGNSTKPAEIDAGRALQLPLYALQLGEQRGAEIVEAEVLHVPVRPERVRARRRDRAYPLKTNSLQEIRKQIARPVTTLIQLLRGGCFPLRKGDHCGTCPYAIACRREHLPTLSRIRAAPAYQAYREVAERRR